MHGPPRPVLYSFRRCPYAMRARLAIASAGIVVDLREVMLRDKPPEFLATSPSGTVPCLSVDGRVIDESLDIMRWALGRNDPGGWLDMPDHGHGLIDAADGAFKSALDRYKYASRTGDVDIAVERHNAGLFLGDLEAMLALPWLFGDAPRLADMAILPFVRQFAHVDIDWWPPLPASARRPGSSRR